MLIYKQFSFDSAHYLPNVPAGHKCGQLHGHTYHLKVYIKGKPDPATGFIMDFTDLKNAVQPVIDVLDHQLINAIEGLSNPTSELLAVWIWDRISAGLPGLAKIELNETPGSGVVYEGE
jgi:6-pyruvoyltetrahydropterin/6-carboxytetrahydropterin synthase